MPNEPISIVNPDLKKLHAYWLEKRGTKFAPTRKDMVLKDLKFILPKTYILDVMGPYRFRYRVAGSDLEHAYGGKLTGNFVHEIDLDHVRKMVLDKYEGVVTDAQPMCVHRKLIKDDGRHLEYENLALPISADGKKIDMLFGAAIMVGFGP
jgi:hypothetical protein